MIEDEDQSATAPTCAIKKQRVVLVLKKHKKGSHPGRNLGIIAVPNTRSAKEYHPGESTTSMLCIVAVPKYLQNIHI